MFVGKIEMRMSGRLLKIARLYDEWFVHLDNPPAFIEELKRTRTADILVFLQEAHIPRPAYPYLKQLAPASVMKVTTYDEWWNSRHPKVRKKVLKAEKSGVQLREVKLDDDFVRAVQKIYNECSLRQGRKFWHYGKSFEQIKRELATFPECTFFIGAYCNNELIGFFKFWEGDQILRTVHTIGTYADRDKCVMDALYAKGVELAAQKGFQYFYCGDWSTGSLGAFRQKFSFERHECPRYFVPLNAKGALALKLGLHRPFRERIPTGMLNRALALRAKWLAWRHGVKPEEPKVAAAAED